MDELELPLKTRLNLETARISWQELGIFFAKGKVLQVATELDLIEVASALASDDTAQVTQWLQAQKIQLLPDAIAKQWAAADHDIWAVVVAPWVVAQKRT